MKRRAEESAAQFVIDASQHVLIGDSRLAAAGPQGVTALVLHYAPRLLISHLAGRPGGEETTCARFAAVLLFVDIVDSTALTDSYVESGSEGAERLAVLLNRYFGRVIDIIGAHGGDAVRIDGDAVIAVWPADAGGADRAARRAAAAALALQGELRERQPFEVALRHRLTLVAGELSFTVCSENGGRRFFVIDGAPVRQLGDARLRGEPDQIVVAAEVGLLLDSRAAFGQAPCGALELLALTDELLPDPDLAVDTPCDAALELRVRSFVPPVILARIDDGQAEWIAEFRKLTAVYVRVVDIDPAAADAGAMIQRVVSCIDAIVAPMRIPITNVLASDKGFVVQIACGLPPFAQEHAPALAVQAALRIHRELAALGVVTGIGITTGEAFCGDVGGAGRREYLSTGPVMNYAARLMQRALDEVLCDSETARAASGSAEFSAPERVEVKGRAGSISIHRVTGAATAAASIVEPIFGRERELRMIDDRLAHLARGLGGVVAFSAEPGAGKSHLLRHVARAARGHAYPTISVSTSPIERTTAYFALRALLAQLLRPHDHAADATLESMRDLLTTRFRGDALGARIALLEDVLPFDFADKGIAGEIKGPARVTGIEEIMVRLAVDRGAGAPLVVIVDDLQWIDASSVQVLAALFRRVPRLLILAATRPVDALTPSSARVLLEAAAPVLELPRLPRDAIRAIVRERLGALAVAAPLVEFIHSRSEGLPFFAEQLLFALRDKGVFSTSAGAASVTASDLSRLVIPGSLRDLIVSRVDLLSSRRQLAIKVASVIGRLFDAEMLRDVHPRAPDPAALLETLEQLIDAGFLSGGEDDERATFAFRHGIIHDVVYDLLPYAQRRSLHRLIAQGLEARHAGALAPHYAVLADHWERAAEGERAIAFRIDAADIAARRNAHADALDHLARVEGLADRFGVVLAPPSRARCTRIRADAHQELTHFDQANEHYRTLAAIEGIDVPRSRWWLATRIGIEATVQALRRAGVIRRLSSGKEKARDGLAAHIHMRFAEHAYFKNDILGLAHGTLAALNRAERAGALVETVNASGGLALGLAAFGFFRSAQLYGDRSIALATLAGSPSAQGFAELLACVQAFHTGDWDRMGLHGERGAVIWKELGDRYRYQCCLVLGAYRQMATGDFRRAEEALAAFGEHAEDIESVQVRAWALAARAMIDLILGRPASSAVARIRAATATGDLHPAECLLCDGIAAAALLEANDYPGALRAAESGLEIVERGSPAMAGALLFSVPYIAEVLLVLAEHAATLGRTRAELIERSAIACRAAQRFAARNRICRPRAWLLRGHHAALQGRTRQQQSLYRTALADAERLGLPLEQAMSHFALAGLPMATAARERHRLQAGEILHRLGVVLAAWRHLPGDRLGAEH